MRRAVLVIVLACASATAVHEARAGEFVLGWDAWTRWDSNVLNRAEDEESDFAIRTGPRMELQQRQGDLTGRLSWSTLWEGYLNTDGAENFEHFLDLDGAWQINARNELRLSNALANTDSITSQLVLEDGEPASPGEGVEVGTSSTLRNRANATFVHRFSPIVSLEASVNNSIFDFERDTSSDSITTRGSLQVTRLLNPRVTVGLGAAFTRQDFDDTPTRSGNGSDVGEVFGILNYQISPTLVMSMSLGPALNRPDDIEAGRLVPEFPTFGTALGPALIDFASCPMRADGSRVVAAGCQSAIRRNPVTGVPQFILVDGEPVEVPATVAPASLPLIEASFLDGGPESESSLTLLGSWALIKQWERSSATLRLQRRTSGASGNGVSTNLTVATVSFTWQPERKWRLTGVAGWTLQASATDVPITEVVVTPDMLFVDGSGAIVDDPALAVYRADGAAVASGIREAGATDSAYETTTYQLQFGATREISRRLTARARLSFFRSQRGGDLQADTTTDSIRAEIGLQWNFDRIHF